MDTTIVTKCFFHQSSQFRKWVTFVLAMLIVSGCQGQTSQNSPTLGNKIDITEDLYHRLKANIFEPGKDPVICHVSKSPNLFQKMIPLFYKESAPHQMVRVFWERGSFWIKSDDHALVVIYMDVEATYSHVHIAPLAGFSTPREFRDVYEHPIR